MRKERRKFPLQSWIISIVFMFVCASLVVLNALDLYTLQCSSSKLAELNHSCAVEL
jgi:hypothetical protein